VLPFRYYKGNFGDHDIDDVELKRMIESWNENIDVANTEIASAFPGGGTEEPSRSSLVNATKLNILPEGTRKT